MLCDVDSEKKEAIYPKIYPRIYSLIYRLASTGMSQLVNNLNVEIHNIGTCDIQSQCTFNSIDVVVAFSCVWGR